MKYKYSRKEIAKWLEDMEDCGKVISTKGAFLLLKKDLLATTDRGGATPGEETRLKHTAKVRPKFVIDRKVHKLQEFLQVNTCGGVTDITVLDDFLNWSEEVTNKLKEIIDYLNK